MSDSNRTRISYGLESTYGTHPGGALIDLRTTGESLKVDKNTVASQELRSDRNIPDLLTVGVSSAGDLNFELSCYTPGSPLLNFDQWWLYLLGSNGYASTVTISSLSCIFTTSGAGTYQGTIQRTGGGSFSTFTVGQWIRNQSGTFTGGSTAANQGWWKIISMGTTSVPNDTITVIGFKDIVSGTVDGAGGSTFATMRQHGMIVNGTQANSITIEKNFQDLSGADAWEIHNGLMIDRVSLSVKNDQIVTGSWGLIGKIGASAGATGGSSYVLTNTNDVMTGVANVVGILEGNKPLAMTEFTMQIQTNLRPRQVIGTLGNIGVGLGSFVVTGTLKAYFATKTLADKYLNATATSLTLAVAEQPTGVAGNYQIWDMQQVKLSAGQVVATGINGDVMMEFSYQALLEAAEPVGNYTLRYTRG